MKTFLIVAPALLLFTAHHHLMTLISLTARSAEKTRLGSYYEQKTIEVFFAVEGDALVTATV